ncbi:hypothetical protein SUGI_0514500 [Cryptomeria japonica]|nr:hypothetical protein SUGI_0514500 [Cryptomeria japonica]
MKFPLPSSSAEEGDWQLVMGRKARRQGSFDAHQHPPEPVLSGVNSLSMGIRTFSTENPNRYTLPPVDKAPFFPPSCKANRVIHSNLFPPRSSDARFMSSFNQDQGKPFYPKRPWPSSNRFIHAQKNHGGH